MIRWQLHLLVLLTTLCVSFAVRASDLGPEVVVQSVRKFHPLVLQAQARFFQAQAEQQAADGSFDLELFADGGVSDGYYEYQRVRTGLKQYLPVWGSNIAGGYRWGQGRFAPYNEYYETLSGGEVFGQVEIPLLRDGWIDDNRASIRAAKWNSQALRWELQKHWLQTATDGVRAYWEWAGKVWTMRVRKHMWDLAQKRQDQLEAQIAVGAVAAIEALENRRTLLDRRQMLLVAQRDLAQAARVLSLYVRDAQGRPRRVKQHESPNLPDVVAMPSLDVERAVAHALRELPNLEALKAKIRQQETFEDLYSNQQLPNADLRFGVSRDLGDGDQQMSTRLSPTELRAEAVVSYPLQNRFARGTHKKWQQARRETRQRLQWEVDQVRVRIRNLATAIRTAAQQFDVAHRAVENARELVEAERKRFELGDTTLFVVNMREAQLAGAEIEMINAHIMLAELRAAWFSNQAKNPASSW